uniref:Uncharacterized protein n=1 Tax=Amphimedon queenslandica TaxID=400682 RepID=A0A1X7VSJ2_AMPQE
VLMYLAQGLQCGVKDLSNGICSKTESIVKCLMYMCIFVIGYDSRLHTVD